MSVLATFADNVFPETDWAAKIPEEVLMAGSPWALGEKHGMLGLLTLQLEQRLPEESLGLVPKLQSANEETLREVGKLIALESSNRDLLEALKELLD